MMHCGRRSRGVGIQIYWCATKRVCVVLMDEAKRVKYMHTDSWYVTIILIKYTYRLLWLTGSRRYEIAFIVT